MPPSKGGTTQTPQHPPTRAGATQSTTRPTSKWYPTKQQLGDTDALERSIRVILDNHYALQDEVAGLKATQAAGASGGSPAPTSGGSGGADSGPKYPPGSGPKDTMLCGLNVAPVDPGSLADGAKLQYDKKAGVFKFV